MRIVNSSNCDLAGSPTECRVTRGAEYLVTSVDLENIDCTLGTGAALFDNHFSGLDVILVASMFIIFILILIRDLCVQHFAAFFTNVRVANLTNAFVIQETIAALFWARARRHVDAFLGFP